MSLELVVANYRRFRRVRWAPSGVSLLVGPNGSGKSTLFTAFQFLSDYLGRDLEKAIEFSGGAWGLKYVGASPDYPVSFHVRAGDIEWSVELMGSRVERVARERVTRGSEPILDQHAGADRFRFRDQEIPVGVGSALGKAASLIADVRDEYAQILKPIEDFRVYSNPHLWTLRKTGSPESSDTYLHQTGKNAFAVLRNWAAGTREHKARYAFVEEGLRLAFPYLFTSFVLRSVARTVVADFYHPEFREPFPFDVAPNGLVLAMLHLTAVASTVGGGVVAIDEFENGLHPEAISSLLERLRDWADEQQLTVLLATHSQTVMNEFQKEKDHVFVLEVDQGEGEWPVRLTERVDREWLAHFSLGDRYGRDFAKQGSR